MTEREYVLGTNDVEIERLGIQHRAWSDLALRAWKRAGFRAGDKLIDIGSGPGYATRDLARLAGPKGRITAVDRSQRFLAHLRAQRLANVEIVEADLAKAALPVRGADGAWSRWVFAFVNKPRALLKAAAKALRPGGKLVLHEYFCYSTFRTVPHFPIVDAFVAAVETSVRAEGGNLDIAPSLLTWLDDAGFELEHAQPIARVARPGEPAWDWVSSFLETGPERQASLGLFPKSGVAKVRKAVKAVARHPAGLIVAPSVMEIIATRR